MKRYNPSLRAVYSITAVLLVFMSWTQAVVAQDEQAVTESGSNREPDDIGPNSRTWMPKSHGGGESPIVEIATGMNYWDGKRWRPSEASFSASHNGFVARRVQHNVWLAPDLNVAPAVSVNLDGMVLQSTPVGIGLYDAASGKFVLIGTVTNSMGRMSATNQVVYDNCFDGCCASVVYTLDIGSFEQDVIFTGRLDPEVYGLPRSTTRIQIITEIYQGPEPDTIAQPIYVEGDPARRKGMVSPDLMDEMIGFGKFVLGTGRAYATASPAVTNGAAAVVGKEYVRTDDGRRFIIESVDYSQLQEGLLALPPCGSAGGGARLIPKMEPKSAYARISAPKRATQVENTTKQAPVAALTKKPEGVVIDYVANISGTLTGNILFAADTNYFVAGTVFCSGPTTIEPTVFKFKASGNSALQFNSTVTCKTSMFRKAVFTSVDDDTIGDSFKNVSGSGYTGTNNPSGYGNPMILMAQTTLTLSNFRFCNAKQAIVYISSSANTSATLTVNHSQFVNCIKAIEIDFGSGVLQGTGTIAVNINNSLIAKATYAVLVSAVGNPVQSTLVNCTVDQGGYVIKATGNGKGSGPFTLNATNSIFANITNSAAGATLSGNYNGFYSSAQSFGGNPHTVTNSPFQSVGAGNYYLTTASGFRSAGTTVSASLTADLNKRTTYPPVVIAVSNISTAQTYSNQVARNTGTLDLGVHYDPIDVAFGWVAVTNTTLTINPGMVIGCFGTNSGTYGLAIASLGTLQSVGTPNNPIWFIQYNTVQEQPITNWFRTSNGLISSEFLGASPGSVINCRFTDFAVPSLDAPAFYCPTNRGPINFQDCEFHSGQLLTMLPTVNFTNCLLERVYADLEPKDGWTNYLRNCLIYGGNFKMAPTNSANSVAQDNLFDKTVITNWNGYSGGFNAYVTNLSRLQPTNTTDVLLTNSLAYQVGPLGNYYQLSNSVLVNADTSLNANQVGLYHYTVMTNIVNGWEIKETNSLLDIGYHYVVVDTNGLPVSSSCSGFADYWADSNGDGLTEAGENPWNFWISAQPQSTNVVQGQDAPFSVTVCGTGPFGYQWLFNGASISGATASSYTRLAVSPADGGNYSVVVTNAAGSLTSSNAVLTVTIPLTITNQPSSLTVVQGVTTNFTVGVDGSNPAYQWWTNSVALVNSTHIGGATTSTVTITNVVGSDATGYNATATNLAGSVTSSVATLSVILPPVIISGPQSRTNVQATDASFSVTASGIGLSYQWQLNGTNISGATNSAYTRLVVQPGDAGNYMAIVMNAAGSASSNATLTVIVPPIITIQPSNVITNQGSNAVFTVGLISSYTTPLTNQWYFDSTNSLANQTNLSLTVTATNAGGYALALTNIAGTNLSVTAWLSVITSSGTNNGYGSNTPPVSVPWVAMITPTNTSPTNPAIYLYGSPISIRASATDTNGYITNVTFYSGTTNATNVLSPTVIGANTTYGLAWTNASPGTNWLWAVAKDNNNVSNVSPRVYVIMDSPPAVWAGGNQTVVWTEGATGTNLTLNGGVTDDGWPYGILTNQWTVLSGNGANVIFNSSTSAVTTATFTTNGVFTLQLTAYDGFTNSSTNCTITIERRPFVSVTAPANNSSFWSGTNIGLKATAYANDSWATVTNVQFWYNGTNLIGNGLRSVGNTFALRWTNAPLWTNSITAVATDSTGLTSTSAPVNIFPFPYLWITSPINGQVLLPRVQVSINATSPTPAMAWVQFFVDTNNLGYCFTPTNGVYQVNWTPLQGGTYTLTAIGTDIRGSNAVSLPVICTVSGLPTVSLTSPTNSSIFGLSPTNLSLKATASAAGSASITNVAFYSAIALSTNLIGKTNSGSGNQYSMNWNNVTNGGYTLRAAATDSGGVGRTSGPVFITVERTNGPPSVNAGMNQTVTLTNAAVLAGIVTDDGLPFGSTLVVRWDRTNTGPGTIVFGNQSNAVTTVSFSAAGTNTFQLAASDGQYSVTSMVQVVVLPTNSPPIVHAGTNHTLILPALGATNPIQTIQVTAVGTANTNMTGIDFFAPSNCLIVSLYGVPDVTTNFALLTTNGALVPFSTNCFSWSNEKHIATVKNTLGGFRIGEVFSGSDSEGEVMRITPQGTNVGNLGTYGRGWVELEPYGVSVGELYGFYVDQSGVWGGDLIASSALGYVWRVNSNGVSTLIATLNEAYLYEPVTTIPNDPSKYGPWAGKILVGSDSGYPAPGGIIQAIDTNGVVVSYFPGVGVADIKVIPEDYNLFATEDGSFTVYGAAASEFQGMAGDIVIADEDGQSLYRAHWNGTGFELNLISSGPKWGQLTFCPAGSTGLTPVRAVQLSGFVSDDGQLINPTTNLWTKVSGPGPVTFDDPSLTNTIARFSQTGTYWLRLTAGDGQFTSWDETSVVVIRNGAPTVNAGSNQVISTTSAILQGSVLDDGLPFAETNILWTLVSPVGASYSFTNTHTAVTKVNFTAPNPAGVYVLRLTADDGEATNFAEVMITVQLPSLTLSPQYGWPSPTNTSYLLTAHLVDANGQPITNQPIQFIVSDWQLGPWTSGTVTNDTNGDAIFPFARQTAGRDVVNATALNQNVSAYAVKDWGIVLNCEASVSSGSGGIPSLDWPTNDVHYADYYFVSAPVGTTLTFSDDHSGNPGFVWAQGMILRDPSNNIIGISVGDADGSQLSYTTTTTNGYMLEVVGVTPQQYLAGYQLDLACNGSTNVVGPSFALVYSGTNIPAGSSIVFATTTPLSPTNLTLLVTNGGGADLHIMGVQTWGDFSNYLAGTTIPSRTGTNLALTFNASSIGSSIGSLVISNDATLGGYYAAYLFGSAFPTGAPPQIQWFSPTNGASFFAPANITLSVTTTNGATNVSYVTFQQLTAAGSQQIGISSTGQNNVYTLPWGSVPDGDYTLAATAVDAIGRTANTAPLSIHVAPSNGNHPPTPQTDQVTVFANSHNNIIYCLNNDTDPDGDTLTIIAKTNPQNGQNAIVNNGTAIIYTPNPSIQGYDGFSYEVSDGRGGTAWAAVYVRIFASDPPQVTIQSPPPEYTTNAGTIVPIVALVSPAQYITKVEFFLGQTSIGIITNGNNGWYTNYWTALFDPCNCSIVAQATDAFGQIGSSEPLHINVTLPGGLGMPIASITNLVGTTTNLQYGVPPQTTIPTVHDGFFDAYGIASHSMGSNVVWKLGIYSTDGTLLRDATPSPDASGYHEGAVLGLLSHCDLTTLINGVYDLRLTVRGGYAETNSTVRFQLESNLKIGQFSFSQQDVSIPVRGMPLTVVRTYNSLNPLCGDFGYGWSYALMDMQATIDETRSDTNDFDGNTFSQRSGGGRDITLTLPDGRRTTFYFSLRLGQGGLAPGRYHAQWQSDPTVTATLTPFDDDTLQGILGLAQGNPYWQAGESTSLPMDCFDFSGFILQTQDGTAYYLSRDDLGTHDMSDGGDGYSVHAWGALHLSKIIEPGGWNTLYIQPTQIYETDINNNITRQLVFQRNDSGLISAIYDPNNITNGPPAVQYVYDGNTNLMAVLSLVDASGGGTYITNSFTYTNSNFPHYMTGMIDPRGVQAAMNLYDDSGRLIAVVDANGNTNQFIHNTDNNMEIVIDRLGRTSTYVYDLSGNITAQTNAAGQFTLYAYDGTNHVLSTTDALLNSTRYAYDFSGNRTQVINPLNQTNSFIYDVQGNVTSQTDPLGNATANSYDGSDNLTNSAQYDSNNNLLGQSFSIYQGNLLSETRNANYQVTASFLYDPAGRMTSSTDANGFSHSFSYDANGNQTGTSYTWSGPGGPTNVTTTTVYDAQGRVVQTIDALGNTNRTFYNVLGKVDYAVDKLGNTNQFFYDARGNVVQTIGPDGLSTRTFFDQDGKPIYTMDRNGITGTRTDYDPAGRVTNTVRLMNISITITLVSPGVWSAGVASTGTPYSTSSTEYFLNGWVKSRTGPDGQKTSYTYYADGQTQTVTDPLNNTTTYAYDAAGRQQYVADALNHTNQFVFDAVGRNVKTIFADNSYITNIFNLLGQQVGKVDQATVLVSNIFDVSGHLTSVVMPNVPDPENPGPPVQPTWTYLYDTNSQRYAMQDAKGRGTTNTFDPFGRLVATRLPLGQTNWTTYDNLGRVYQQYDFKGQVELMRYDRLGRPATNYWFAAGATYPSNSVEYYYDALGQLTNITERSGTDASSGYIASNSPRHRNKYLAALTRVPEEARGGGLSLVLVASGVFFIPRRKRQLFAEAVARAWGDVRESWRLPVEESRRRLWLPSLFWRYTTYFIIFVVLITDPKLDFWSLHADCVYPPNSSTETSRYTTFTYDMDGHLTQVNCPEGVINYGYDLATGRHTSTCTTNSYVGYGYDQLGRLQTVMVSKRNGVTLGTNEVTTYTYDAVGNRASMTNFNNVVTTYHYDSLNRLTNLTHALCGTNLLASYSYVLHPTGRRTNAVEILKQENGTWLTNTLSWTYDQMYRLTNEVSMSSAPSNGGTYTNAYQYDKVGNRFTLAHSQNGSTTTTTNLFDVNDQLIREVTLSGGTTTQTNWYAYDSNGSQTARTNITSTITNVLYSYDLKNKLSSATTLGSGQTNSFIYNYQGIRVRTTAGGAPTYYLVDANNHTGYQQVLEELPAPGLTANRSYVLGDDVIAQANSSPSYFLHDGHGNTRQMADTTGTVSSRYNYDAYGQTLATSTSPVATTMLYCGEQYDSGLGMYNLRARYYNPTNGRFSQRDAFQGDDFDPQSLHKYIYTKCDPMNGVDPSGNFTLVELMFSIAILVALHAAAVPILNNRGFHSDVKLMPDAGILGIQGSSTHVIKLLTKIIPGAEAILAPIARHVVGIFGVEILFSIISAQFWIFLTPGVGGTTVPGDSLYVYSGLVWNLYNADEYKGSFYSFSAGGTTWGGSAFAGDQVLDGDPFSGPWGLSFGRSYGPSWSASLSWTDYIPIDKQSYSSMGSSILMASAWAAGTSLLLGQENVGGFAAQIAAASFWPYFKWSTPEKLLFRQTHDRAGKAL